jgi:hypothetical protein
MTTQEMIEVMQAYDDGNSIEFSEKSRIGWFYDETPKWNWVYFTYRVKRLTRDEMINRLVDDDIRHILLSAEYGDYSYLNDALSGNGFTPYTKRTDEEIKHAYTDMIANNQERQ